MMEKIIHSFATLTFCLTFFVANSMKNPKITTYIKRWETKPEQYTPKDGYKEGPCSKNLRFNVYKKTENDKDYFTITAVGQDKKEHEICSDVGKKISINFLGDENEKDPTHLICHSNKFDLIIDLRDVYRQGQKFYRKKKFEIFQTRPPVNSTASYLFSPNKKNLCIVHPPIIFCGPDNLGHGLENATLTKIWLFNLKFQKFLFFGKFPRNAKYKFDQNSLLEIIDEKTKTLVPTKGIETLTIGLLKKLKTGPFSDILVKTF